MKRWGATLAGLGIGVLALWLFFAWLFTLFRSEREAGAREAAAHRVALEAYALGELTAGLRAQLAAASEQLEQVRADPLLDDSALFLVAGGEQVVPPPRGPAGAEAAEAMDPALGRLELVEQLEQAVERGDRGQTEKLTRALLAERARYVVPVTLDAPLVLRAVAALRRAGPAPELLRMLLREGVSLDGQGVLQGLEGLQRAVLRRKARLGGEALAKLCADVVRASREANVPAADFEARCLNRPTPRPPVWQLLDGESLWRGAPTAERAAPPTWFLRAGDGQAEGVAVELGALVEELTARLRGRGLLQSGDGLDFTLAAGSSKLEDFTLTLASPGWRVAAQQREERFVLKSVLLGVSAALSLGLAALAVLAQRRKLKFLELKSDFVATVSHELRTPLASMPVMAETLERRLEGHAAARDYPARIVREVDGLALLVDNILSFNRLDKGRWQRRPGAVELSSVVPLLREEAERYPGAKVELGFEGFDGAGLDADGELLQLLLVNLLRNACKYNREDPVRVRFAREGATLRVTDNGVGIPPAEWENVFVEFNRLPGQRGRGGAGSGLGLALARRIMALHQGSIAVERSDASGTTFVLKFGATRA